MESERDRDNAQVKSREADIEYGERDRNRGGAPVPCGRRQSEFRELALTGRYCRVHLASVQFGSWI